MKSKKISKYILIIIFIICLCGLVYSSYEIIKWKLNVDENKEIKKKINISIKKEKKENTTKYNIDFKSLKEQNPDTIAYIKVNNTNIDYVVVKGNDNEYYLKHNFEKKWNIAGWIFGDYHNKFDGTDKNLVIYGHNTKDGSMFGTLVNILNKDWYEKEENHEIVLVTEKDQYIYQVFSTYSIKPEDYYINTEFSNDDEFKKYIEEVKSRSNYDYQIEVNEKDKILTLSSCLYDSTRRVVLHAKLK